MKGNNKRQLRGTMEEGAVKRCCKERFRLGIKEDHEREREREREKEDFESNDEERGEEQQLMDEEETAPAAGVQEIAALERD